MKKLLAMLMAVMLVFAIAGSAMADQLDDILARGYWTIGTEGTYRPNSYHDEATNELVGFDVEVAKAIGDKLGIETRYLEDKWNSLFMHMDNGVVDTIINEVEYTEERALKYDFSAPYTYIHGALLVAANNTEISSFDDLNGKKAAQNTTSTWGMMAESLGATLVPVNADAETFELIQYGRADFTLNAETAFNNYMAAHPEVQVKIVAYTDSASSSVVPVVKGNERLVEAINNAIAELTADGTLSELSIKYFGFDYTNE